MLATASPVPVPAAPVMSTARNTFDPDQSPGQPQLKRHKVLPRPGSVRSQGPDASPSKRSHRSQRSQPELAIDTSVADTTSQTSSPRTLKHQSRRIGAGPELPPTPPTHSRTSSSSQSALPSSPTLAVSPSPGPSSLQTPKNESDLAPATPPDQRSPLTPDVTPPQPATRLQAPPRLTLAHRGASHATTVDSRADSFQTAREDPISSEGEEDQGDGTSTARPASSSGGTSETISRKASDTPCFRMPKPKALDMALAQLTASAQRQNEARFERSHTAADHGMGRSVTVMKRQPADAVAASGSRRSVVEDPFQAHGANNATQAVRQMSLNEKVSPGSSSKSRPATRSSSGPSRSETSVSTSHQKSSGVSSRSITSTVEAFLIEAPRPPQRQRTLRHVQKQSSLRHLVSAPRGQPAAAAAAAASAAERGRSTVSRPPLANQRHERAARHDSFTSTTSASSTASGKARRDASKNGGVPVAVVPDRRSSRSQSREPSLRSTSSRRSRRAQSVSSALTETPPLETPFSQEFTPNLDRLVPRSRTYSVSDASDTRTMDFPPMIPVRSSSLSAPTSRNVSRAASMTAGSAQTKDALHGQMSEPRPRIATAPSGVVSHKKKGVQHLMTDYFKPTPKLTSTLPFEKGPAPIVMGDSKRVLSPPRLGSPLFSPKPESEGDGRFDSDRQEDGQSSRKYSSRNTPFSIASLETNGTNPEVSEAQAVHMYSHQNSSLLMVNNSSGRPSEATDSSQDGQDDRIYLPSIQPQTVQATLAPADDVPLTPPQPTFLLEDVDSPLRNPRAPPEPPVEPPAITFTSATPSGATPAPDKALQLGNYFDTMAEVPSPERRRSIMGRAFKRGRSDSTSYPPNSSRSTGLLKRAFSLSRRRNTSTHRLSYSKEYPSEVMTPPEEDKLHPFWRSQFDDDDFDDWDDRYDGRDQEHDEEDEGHMRYPPIDNRPSKPKRRFSEKMKRTFAIMPIRDDEEHSADDVYGPERRTIRRTPSGNLRVMRRRNSASSLRRRFSQSDRPETASEEDRSRGLWRGMSSNGRTRSESRRRFSLGDQFEEIQNLSRKLSDRRRERRTRELRQKISGPRDVRDGVEEMIRSSNQREQDEEEYHPGAYHRVI